MIKGLKLTPSQLSYLIGMLDREVSLLREAVARGEVGASTQLRTVAGIRMEAMEAEGR